MKIILSFFVSSLVIASLSVFLFFNFIEIKKETKFLELTDTIRSKSLQLRRHEKNYLLYAPYKIEDESKAIHSYLDELDSLLTDALKMQPQRVGSLNALIGQYRDRFSGIESLVKSAYDESELLGASSKQYAGVRRLIESNFLDKPVEDIKYLKDNFGIADDHMLIKSLSGIDSGIAVLRKTGEEILAATKELDREARAKVDNFIRMSSVSIIVLVPMFLVVGFGTLLYITGDIVKHLRMLTGIVEKTGKGDFTHVSLSPGGWAGHDEVRTLLEKFNAMEDELAQRERELLQSKKLAAIGTLASGVAHELNNPLNNIYTTAQRLLKKSGESSDILQKGLSDIFIQTLRVKKIVAGILEFARGREPNPRPIELSVLLKGAFRQIAGGADASGVEFKIDLSPHEIVFYADLEQMEQVFVNLFTNAMDAMEGRGELRVTATEEDDTVSIKVSDTGRGIKKEDMEKIFEPFYTTKDKGTGLGTAIVFNIIQKHGGDIKVESEEGNGASFIIRLPKNIQNRDGEGHAA